MSNKDITNAHEMAAFRAALTSNHQSSASKPIIATEADTDKARGLSHNSSDSVWASKKNFDQKIYWFPPHYNELRRELHDNWKNLWALTSYRMAFMPEEFCALMNDATDLKVMFDSDAVDFMCEHWLNRLRQMRGAA